MSMDDDEEECDWKLKTVTGYHKESSACLRGTTGAVFGDINRPKFSRALNVVRYGRFVAGSSRGTLLVFRLKEGQFKETIK